MKTGGVSICGSFHKNNQDSFTVQQINGGFILAVSDGLGSRKLSQAGSAALCQAACNVAENFSCNIDDEENFLSEVNKCWLQILFDYELKISDCNATALIGVKNSNTLWLFRLGDGFIGAAFDDTAVTLFDDKEEEFTNVTNCLEENFCYELWNWRKIEFENFVGIVAATDGLVLEINEDNLNKFIKEFCKSYEQTSAQEILTDIKIWLPKFKGIDDKTLAFLLEE